MIFVRHPKPEIGPAICYGQLDLDIADEGHAQIIRAMEITPRVSRILASPALRCRKLALALAERDGIEPEFDPRLWEMHMGDWEGLAWADIPRHLSDPWLQDPYNLPAPGGESFAILQTRVLAALEPVGRAAARRTAVVCHAGPIRAAQMSWQGLSFKQAFASIPGFAEPIELHPPHSGEQQQSRQSP